MARPLRIEFEGAFYHVTSRGNERKEVFRSRADREKFLSYLESAVIRYGAVVHAYCLMSNHYHLLLETPRGNLSQIMRHINGAYTTYFNVKRKRSGHLFQGRYKAIVVEADEYALELSRYLHLNPVRAGMVTLPEEYEWSSFRSYAGISPAPPWLTRDLILAYFHGRNAGSQYGRFVGELVGGTYETPLKAVVASTLLGTAEFVATVSESHTQVAQCDRNVPAAKQLAKRPSVEQVIETVKEVVGDHNPLWRKIAIHLCHRHTGMKLKEIGNRFGMGDAAISVASKRFAEEADRNEEMRAVLVKTKKLFNVET